MSNAIGLIRNEDDDFLEYGDGTPGRYNGGIDRRYMDDRMLAVGTRLVRFVNFSFGAQLPDVRKNQTSFPSIARGNWWIRVSEFDKLRAHALKYGQPLSAAMRDLCSIPKVWSNLSLYVICEVKIEIPAKVGVGNPAIWRTRDGRIATNASFRPAFLEQINIKGRFVKLKYLEHIGTYSSVVGAGDLRAP